MGDPTPSGMLGLPTNASAPLKPNISINMGARPYLNLFRIGSPHIVKLLKQNDDQEGAVPFRQRGRATVNRRLFGTAVCVTEAGFNSRR
jgi:hypothetical protein